MDVETIFERARLLVGDLAERFETPAPNRLDVYMRGIDDLKTVATRFHGKRLGYLTALTGMDIGVDCPDLEILYHFCNGPAIVTLRFRVCKADAVVPTLVQIIPSVESFERELAEMFGIRVAGLRTTDYLYLPDDWNPGQLPLRKDFNPNQQVVVQQPSAQTVAVGKAVRETVEAHHEHA